MRFLILLLLLSGTVQGQDFSLYEKHYFNAPELNMPYRYLRPAVTDSTGRFPLIIFLHGAAQRGFDNESPLAIGGRFFLRDSVRRQYPAFILFPQCPEIDTWAYFEIKEPIRGGTADWNFPFHKQPTGAGTVLKQLIDSLVRADAIDPDRVYIGGLSQGGMGVLDQLARFPGFYAAGFSICGAGAVQTARYIANRSALWLFHGAEDDVVPVDFSRQYFKRLSKAGADVRYSEYKGIKHNSWNEAFQEPDLLPWLFSKNKKGH
ncbi:MAG TPA: PHB depolymerase family esterase [Flavisolibacter sp.]|jgi:predicted peptidase|nr:PHB depolymerase family esterase [Flavisolibacter sp.]